MLDFYVETRVRFSLRDKRLFEITEVEIMRVDCTMLLNLSLVSNLKANEKLVYRQGCD